MSNQNFTDWVENNADDLRDQWSTMGIVEKFEEGPTFEDYVRNQYSLLPTV